MLLGSIGLRGKDFFFAANLAYFLMLLFCGVNVPLAELPGWMRRSASCLPLTHGIVAAREVAAGASPRASRKASSGRSSASAWLRRRGFGLFRLLEPESRRSAVLDSY